jgi:hypothetical protein
MRRSIYLLATLIATSATAAPSSEVTCTYAPSQSNAVAAVSGAAGGATATAGAVAAATGLTAVAHSSGALILTGTSGYIAGTIGATAATVAAAPVVVGVGLLVGGVAVTLELVCAGRNHPDQVKKVIEASAEFSSRFSDAVAKVRIAGADAKKSVVPAAENAVVTIRQGARNVWQYAYRKSIDFSQSFGK